MAEGAEVCVCVCVCAEGARVVRRLGREVVWGEWVCRAARDRNEVPCVVGLCSLCGLPSSDTGETGIACQEEGLCCSPGRRPGPSAAPSGTDSVPETALFARNRGRAQSHKQVFFKCLGESRVSKLPYGRSH